MKILCFDISSSGVSAAVFGSELEILKFSSVPWSTLGATLSTDTVLQQVAQAVRDLEIAAPLDAICLGSFMHSCILLDGHDRPLTPVLTWLDVQAEDGVQYVRTRLGADFHERTGCRFHPMFPIFKLASLRLRNSNLIAETRRVVSIKAFLIHRLTGVWMEDFGMASASGLYNLHLGDWDPALLELVKLNRDNLPAVSRRDEIVGMVSTEGATEFGVPVSTPVANGSGDGFFAHLGSDCETAGRVSVSLGTSAVVRQSVSGPILDSSSGTFCYKADDKTYLLGCAGSNGGNVLDWGRSMFGELESNASSDPPIFIPLLHGERSPEWNALLRGSWHGLTAQHRLADLGRSVIEGVVFNLGYLFEILQRTSAQKASEIVLSGNGFLQPLTAPILAAILGVRVSAPSKPGLASLRGAAMCAMGALGEPNPQLHTYPVTPLNAPNIVDRYRRFEILRQSFCTPLL